MNRYALRGIIALVGGALGIYLLFGKPTRRDLPNPVGLLRPSPPPSNREGGRPSTNPTPPPWEEQLSSIQRQMQQLVADPAAIDQELTDFAKSLTAENLQILTKTLFSSSAEGDEKLLATELLARSPLGESIEPLKQIIAADNESISSSRALQEEFRAFQMLAIEGLGSKTEHSEQAELAIKELLTKVEDSTLLDRLNRSLWALKGAAPPPQEQDEEALKKLLEQRR